MSHFLSVPANGMPTKADAPVRATTIPIPHSLFSSPIISTITPGYCAWYIPEYKNKDSISLKVSKHIKIRYPYTCIRKAFYSKNNNQFMIQLDDPIWNRSAMICNDQH